MIKVSALVSLYNAMEFVEGCLEDLVQQTIFQRGEMEIVVIDSNSPQDERSVVELYQARYPNIVYHRTEERETLYQAWNRGIELARGQYLTNANADDRHRPDGIECHVKVLDARPDIDLVYADVYQSRVPNQPFRDNPRQVEYRYPTFYAPYSLIFHQFGCQPVWRRRIHAKMGGFDPTYRAAGDWDFCVRFTLAGFKALHIKQALGSFLERDDSISSADSTSNKEQKEVRAKYLNKAVILALYYHEGRPIETPEDQARVFTEFAAQASTVSLPWTPGKLFNDQNAALVACRAAVDVAAGNPRVAWNMGVALHSSGYMEYAMPFLERGFDPQNPNIAHVMGAAKEGKKIRLPYLALD